MGAIQVGHGPTPPTDVAKVSLPVDFFLGCGEQTVETLLRAVPLSLVMTWTSPVE